MLSQLAPCSGDVPIVGEPLRYYGTHRAASARTSEIPLKSAESAVNQWLVHRVENLLIHLSVPFFGFGLF